MVSRTSHYWIGLTMESLGQWNIWPLLGLGGILFFRRLPVIGVLYGFLKYKAKSEDLDDLRHPFQRKRDFWFYGWFGPIGLSSIYYATTAHQHLKNEVIWHIASFIAFGSIIVHGLTAAVFTRAYDKVDAH